MTVKLDGDIIMGEIAATADKRYLNPQYGSLEDMGSVCSCTCTTCHPYFFSRDAQGRSGHRRSSNREDFYHDYCHQPERSRSESMQEMGGLTVGLQMTPGGSRALFGTPSSSGELLRSSSRGLFCETSGSSSSRRLNGGAGSSRALLLTPLRDGPLLIGRANPSEPQHLPLHQSYLEPPSLLEPARLKADLSRPTLLQQPPINHAPVTPELRPRSARTRRKRASL